MSLFIFHTELKPRERGTQFPLISASLEGFSNALTSQRRQRQQMTDLKDWHPNVSATEPTLLHPCLTHVAVESWSSRFSDIRLKDRKLAKVRIVLLFLERNVYSNKEPLCWWSKNANIAFCCIQPKLSFQQELSRLPKQEQSQMHSKTVYCTPM